MEPTSSTTQAPAGGPASGATSTIANNASANNNDFMGLLGASTSQTLQIQMALLNHNLTVGPAMAAKSASDDAKKT